MIHTMFPMLGPPRNTPQNTTKNTTKNTQKNVRLVEPTTPSIDSDQTTYSRQHIPPATHPLQEEPPPPKLVRKPSLSSSKDLNPAPIFPRTLVVISFITRFPLKPNQGQGSELLFYKPKNLDLHPSDSHVPASCISKWACQKPEDKTKWTFLFIDGERIEEGEEELEEQVNKLSNRSIRRHLTPPEDRLIHVRNSKPLRWDSDTTLVAVLYLLKNINLKIDQDWIKINVHSHYWSKINGFHSAIENDLVSTALAAVCFPVAFNVGFEEIAAQDHHIRSDLVTLKALDTLYLSVQAGYARDGFRFYPKSAEPLKKVGNSDRDFKRRIWAYWTEVLCWHLIVCRSTFKVSISYTLHKIMVELKPAVKDDKVNVEELEKIMVKAIGKEADRCRQSVDNIVNHAIFEILHNPIFTPSITSSNSLHLFTLGSSSATFGTLSQLIKHFITQSRWKLDFMGERERTGLRITIGECRPLHEGVTLARKLNELIQVYDPPAGSLPNLGYHDSINDWYLDSNHQKVAEKFDHPLNLPPLHSDPVQPNQDDGPAKLDDLLQQLDKSRKNQGIFNIHEPEKIKVMIEITTDVGLRSCLLNAGHTAILLLSADRVLPNGDALCKLGSFSAAHTAHTMNQIVIILVRHDRIEPATDLECTSSSSEEEEETRSMSGNKQKRRKKKKSLIERQECWDDQRHKKDGPHPLIVSSLVLSWKSVFKSHLIDLVSNKTHVAGSAISCPNLAFDTVKAQFISFYITDSGIIGLERVKEVSNTLTVLTRLLWEEEEDDFM